MSKFIDIHILQSMPASNLNRDDTGRSKTVVYGGALRSRVSSQAWKKATRDMFAQEPKSDILKAHRTKRIAYLIADEMMKQDDQVDQQLALDKAKGFIEAGISSSAFEKGKDKDEYQTKTLIMLSNGQIRKIAKYCLKRDLADFKDKDQKDAIKRVFAGENSLDLALFGRMVADDANLNIDASCQVAHAFSVNEIVPETDYFTAVDDDSINQGSAFIQTADYNTGVYYRYANVNVTELVHNLDNNDLVNESLKLFLKDFILSIPTGKQNSYANRNLPSYIMLEVRGDAPVNLASAFEKPVRTNDGYMQKAIKRLEEEHNREQLLVEKPVYTAVVNTENKDSMNLKEAIDHVIEHLGK